jgi:transcriptional regulator with XRE-family HTH domain
MGRTAKAKEITETDLLREVANALRARRKQLGLTMEEVAQAAGISRVTLHRIEKGEPSVSAGAVASVSKTLGTPLTTEQPNPVKSPDHIVLRDYPGLASLTWQLEKETKLSRFEAWSTYARNWRHLDPSTLLESERELINILNEEFGGPNV